MSSELEKPFCRTLSLCYGRFHSFYVSCNVRFSVEGDVALNRDRSVAIPSDLLTVLFGLLVVGAVAPTQVSLVVWSNPYL